MGGTTAAISWSAGADAKDIAAAINSKANDFGVTATASNSATISGISEDGNITFALNGSSISASGVTTSDYSSLVTAINSASGSTGVVASFTTPGLTNSITLTAADGRDIKIDTYANSGANAASTVSFSGTTLTEGAASNDSAIKTGTVELSSSKGAISTAAAGADVFASAGVNTSTLSSVAAINIKTASNAQSAISVIDAAIQTINSSRGDLGALQNRFSSTIANLQTSAENISASRGRIIDADFAQETANLTRGQILQQAGTAMLAQANSLPQGVLSLLRG